MEGLLCPLGLFWLVCGVLGSFVAGQKGRGTGEGFLMGILFGPFGVLLEALLPTLEQPKTTTYTPPQPTAAELEMRRRQWEKQQEAYRQQLLAQHRENDRLAEEARKRRREKMMRCLGAPRRCYEKIGDVGQAIVMGLAGVLVFFVLIAILGLLKVI